MKRRKFTAEFKAKIALEAVHGFRTINEIARENQIHPNLVSKWKKEMIDRLPLLYSDKNMTNPDLDREKERLYQEIGKLQVELNWLKKKIGPIG